jgi:hypothetical protein
MQHDLHSHALVLVERGLAVFPLKERDKAPATRHGFKDATHDRGVVDGWWKGWPEQNIGIATGKASGVWVLDVDGEKGEASLAALIAQHGPLPATIEAITGKGRHIYFRYAEGIGSTAGRLGPGLDTRGDDGYVVAPPSLHPSGRRYAWSVDSGDGFAEAPGWLVELARVAKPNGAAGPSEPTGEAAALLAKLKPGLRRLIATEMPVGDDRSKHSFRVMCKLFEAGFSDGDVLAVADGAPFARKFWTRGDLPAEIGRVRGRWNEAQAKRAATAATGSDDALDAMNARFAVVRVGGRTRVMALEKDPARRGALVPTYSTIPDFKAFHDRDRIEIVDGNGEVKRLPKGSWWIKSERRRQYEAVVFEPGAEEDPAKFNLWRGFTVEPIEGDCSLYLAHLTDNVCRGDDEHASYLLDYLAFGVQHPGERAEVAVVLKGGEGTGKGMAVNPYGSLFGPHYLHISQPGHLTGHFNAHLQLTRVLFADEALFAADPRHAGPLKALITEDTILIEPKGLDTYTVRNCLMVFMASNEAWVVPAGADARRFFVLEVSEARKQDHRYFAAIAAELDAGGREALLWYLLNRDLADFNIRAAPLTEALADQKAHSRKGIDLLVEMLATEGKLPAARMGFPHITITSGEHSGGGFYPAARKCAPDLKRVSSIVIKRTLRKEWGCSEWRSSTQAGIAFPPLVELRARFDRKHGVQEWPDLGEWCEDIPCDLVDP